MRVPRERIKIAFRLWIPILVLRIVVAETEAWPQALGLSALGLASIVSDIFSLKLSLERDFFQIAKGFHLGKTGNRNSYCSDFGCRGLGGDVNH